MATQNVVALNILYVIVVTGDKRKLWVFFQHEIYIEIYRVCLLSTPICGFHVKKIRMLLRDMSEVWEARDKVPVIFSSCCSHSFECQI